MESRVVRSIREFDAATWDGLVGANPFSRHRFVSLLERSEIPGVKLFHVLFFHQGKPVGCTSFYTHPFSLDLIAPTHIRQVCNWVQKFSGNLLKTRVLFCGLPISIGKSHFWMEHSLAAELLPEMWQELDRILRRHAQEEGISLWGAKEFDRRNFSKSVESLARESGYVCCHSLSTVTLNIRWDSMDHYLASLRAHYRRQAISDMRQSAQAQVNWQRVSGSEVNPAEMYALYSNVFARAENRLEMLSREFFKELPKEFAEQVEYVLGVHQGRVVAQALLFHEGDVTTFLFAGLDYRHVKPFGIYRNLLLQVVKAAIERKTKVLELGQTSYDVKQRLGGLPRPLHFYLKQENPLVHLLLRQGAPVFFPEVRHERRKVFRQDHGLSGDTRSTIETVHAVSQNDLPRRSKLDSAA